MSENKVTLDLGDMSLGRFADHLDRIAEHYGWLGTQGSSTQHMRGLAAQVREQIPKPPLPEPVQWCVVQEDAPGPHHGLTFVRDCADPERQWTRIGHIGFANRWTWSMFTKPVILWPFSKKRWDL
jgi:hypothetical protein